MTARKHILLTTLFLMGSWVGTVQSQTMVKLLLGDTRVKTHEVFDAINVSRGVDPFKELKSDPSNATQKMIDWLNEKGASCAGCVVSEFIKQGVQSIQDKHYQFVFVDHIDSKVGIPSDASWLEPMIRGLIVGAVTRKNEKKVYVVFSDIRIVADYLGREPWDVFFETLANELVHVQSDFSVNPLTAAERQALVAAYVTTDDAEKAASQQKLITKSKAHLLQWIEEEIASSVTDQVVSDLFKSQTKEKLSKEAFLDAYQQNIEELKSTSVPYFFRFLGFPAAGEEEVDQLIREAQAAGDIQAAQIFLTDIMSMVSPTNPAINDRIVERFVRWGLIEK